MLAQTSAYQHLLSILFLPCNRMSKHTGIVRIELTTIMFPEEMELQDHQIRMTMISNSEPSQYCVQYQIHFFNNNVELFFFMLLTIKHSVCWYSRPFLLFQTDRNSWLRTRESVLERSNSNATKSIDFGGIPYYLRAYGLFLLIKCQLQSFHLNVISHLNIRQ